MIYDMPQHSDEWYQVRTGKWTASNAAIIMSKIGPQGGMTKGLQDLIKSVAWERCYGVIDEPRYQSQAMERGNDLEDEARDWYEFEHNVQVKQVGFVTRDDMPTCGYSPDGLTDDSAIEIKCLLHKAMMDVIKKREVPSEYVWQCNFACIIGKLETIDFVPYHPAYGGLTITHKPAPGTEKLIKERIKMLDEKVNEWVQI